MRVRRETIKVRKLTKGTVNKDLCDMRYYYNEKIKRNWSIADIKI